MSAPAPGVSALVLLMAALAHAQPTVDQSASKPASRANVALELAAAERDAGKSAPARARLEALLKDPLSPAQRQRALELVAAIADDEAALALEDWPDPPTTDAQRGELRRAARELDDGNAAGALKRLESFAGHAPGEARWIRARAHEQLRRHDRATRELEVLVRLRPSHAAAWRRLGVLLAEHGGALQAERADEALRRALALEPSWDDLRALRAQVASQRDRESTAPQRALAAAPSLQAQRDLEEARRWIAGEARELAEPLLVRALTSSPGFVDAAVALYGIAGHVPEATVGALRDDPEGLLRLATAVDAIGGEPAAPLVRPWLDRAVARGSTEALYVRARLRAQGGDTPGALADLGAYVGGSTRPPRLTEARVLLTSLLGGTTAPSPERRAELALAADRPREAEQLLGGPCRAGLPAQRLLALGRVREYQGARAPALDCYRLALEAAGGPGGAGARGALERLAKAAARAPVDETQPLRPLLVTADRAGVPAAALALSRLAEARGEPEHAAALLARYLAAPGVEAAERQEAQKAHLRLDASVGEAARAHAARVRIGLLGGGLALMISLSYIVIHKIRGHTLASAVRRRPALYPRIAAALGEIRHDVLKHRASALGLLAEPGTRRQEVVRTMIEPVPASRTVAAVYQRLRLVAAEAGTPLVPLPREPVLGPLATALARAETLLRGDGGQAELLHLDQALREEHGPALGALLAQGPRTRVDPVLLSRWFEAARGSLGAVPWTAPAVQLESLGLEALIGDASLGVIFINVLRNAVQAVAECPVEQRRVAVQVTREQDVTGRRFVVVQVADSSPRRLSAHDFERGQSDRGLGIVRETALHWGAELIVRDAPAPLVKAVALRIPAATEAAA